MSNGIFKCADCGEKYNHAMASANDVALCKWCDTVELERNACEEVFPNQIQKTVEDMEWEEDIVRFCGWSMERVQEEIHEIGIETGWHEDDDRQDILESLVGKILDDAKEYLLPKYYEQWKLSQA